MPNSWRGISIGNQKQLLENFRNKTVKNIGLLQVSSEQVCGTFCHVCRADLADKTGKKFNKQAAGLRVARRL
jgi:hypothetical protein